MSRIKYLLAKFLLKIQLPAITKSEIDSTAKVCSRSHVYGSSLGSYSYIGNNCKVFHCHIGKYCSIADDCFLGGAEHPVNHVSTSPVFHKGKNIMRTNFAYHDDPPSKGIEIGNDVWIGASVLVKDGVKIGDGAVVAMGAVVTKDVEPYSIVAGVPARNIRYRFSREIIDHLLLIRWWDWDTEKIKYYAEHFDDIDDFILSLEKEKKKYE